MFREGKKVSCRHRPGNDWFPSYWAFCDTILIVLEASLKASCFSSDRQPMFTCIAVYYSRLQFHTLFCDFSLWGYAKSLTF